MKIALDVMGGDFAPQNPIAGVKLALESLPAITKLLLVGIPEVIEKELKLQGVSSPKLEIVPATQVVDMSDSGLDAVRAYFDAKIDWENAPSSLKLPPENPDRGRLYGELLRHM